MVRNPRSADVRLKKGEANLKQASVVTVTQIRTIDRERLHDPIGSLSPERIRQVLEGLSLVLGLDTLPADRR